MRLRAFPSSRIFEDDLRHMRTFNWQASNFHCGHCSTVPRVMPIYTITFFGLLCGRLESVRPRQSRCVLKFPLITLQ